MTAGEATRQACQRRARRETFVRRLDAALTVGAAASVIALGAGLAASVAGLSVAIVAAVTWFSVRPRTPLAVADALDRELDLPQTIGTSVRLPLNIAAPVHAAADAVAIPRPPRHAGWVLRCLAKASTAAAVLALLSAPGIVDALHARRVGPNTADDATAGTLAASNARPPSPPRLTEPASAPLATPVPLRLPATATESAVPFSNASAGLDAATGQANSSDSQTTQRPRPEPLPSVASAPGDRTQRGDGLAGDGEGPAGDGRVTAPQHAGGGAASPGEAAGRVNLSRSLSRADRAIARRYFATD